MKVLRNHDEARALIRKREEFRSAIRDIGEYRENKIASIRGENNPYEMGALPGRYWPSFRTAAYAVYSYHTPIAWYATVPHDDLEPELVVPFLLGQDHGLWVVPAIKYSVATNNHQSLVHAALGYPMTYTHRWEGDRLITETNPNPKAIPYSTGWGEYDEKVPMGTRTGSRYYS